MGFSLKFMSFAPPLLRKFQQPCIVYARSNASFAPSFVYELVIASYNHRRFRSNSTDIRGENVFSLVFFERGPDSINSVIQSVTTVVCIRESTKPILCSK